MSKELEQIIIEKIEYSPITFYEFMQTALYHDEWGYYINSKPKIGRSGDFYTSPNVHSAFGYCIAEQIFEMWGLCNKPSNFKLVEMGPGTGLLAKDILTYLQNYKELFDGLQYILVETSPYLKGIQEKELSSFINKCLWIDTIENLDSLVGVFFSNELVDAFPVHKITLKNGIIKEIYVNYKDGTFIEELGPVSNKKIYTYIEKLGFDLQEEQEIEVNLDAIDWLRNISKALKKGFLITIDYGYKAQELLEPFRFKGTLMSYAKHSKSENVLDNPGEQDITAHVNFSALMDAGKEFGLHTAGYTSQMRFLVNLNIHEKASNNIKDIYAIKRLIMPNGMGERFKVLIQYKGLNEQELKLTGLQGFFKPLSL